MATPPSSLQVNDARTWRGGELQTLLLLRGLRARGGSASLAAPEGCPLAPAAAAEGIPVLPLSLGGDLDLAGAMALAGLLREHKPAIIHAHTSHALAAAVTARRLVNSAARLVFSRRVDFPVRTGPFHLGRRKYLAADCILAVSAAAAASLAAGALPPGRGRIVHDGIDPERFAVPAHDLVAELGLPTGTRVVLNVAALVDHKDQRSLVAAAPALLARHPDVVVALVGEGEERSALTQQIGSLGLQNRVRLLGFRSDVPALLRGAHAAVLCSHLEGFGTAALDAMVCGVPLVATRAGGIPELVDDGVSGLLVPTRHPASLAAALGDVLGNTELAAVLTAGGLRRAAEFSADRMVEGTLAAYESLA